MTKPARVVVVDDSAFMRQLIAQTLAADHGLEVAGTARDAYQAREVIKATNPDVVTLDVEMPGMDGLDFLTKIMTLRPMPVVMVSTVTKEGSDATIRALELGAVDYVAKPQVGDDHGIVAFRDELITKVRLAARARIRTRLPRSNTPPPAISGGRLLIAVGASTGGVERIRGILERLPRTCPPIVITQHMGSAFLSSFAARLDGLVEPSVQVATGGERLVPGSVLIAPGEAHLVVEKIGTAYVAKLEHGPLVSGHRPSVDVLFESVARSVGKEAIGTILSGMGKDGAKGLLSMRAAGATTFGEQESSCVVYGMPRAAHDAGGVMVELPWERMAGEWLKVAESCGRDRPN